MLWIGEIIEQHWRTRLVGWKREFEYKAVAWMGTVVDAKGIEVVEVRDGDRGRGNVVGTREVLPRL